MNLATMTCVQQMSIPVILRVKDVLIKSQTGSGKIVQRVDMDVLHGYNENSLYINIKASENHMCMCVHMTHYDPKEHTVSPYCESPGLYDFQRFATERPTITESA